MATPAMLRHQKRLDDIERAARSEHGVSGVSPVVLAAARRLLESLYESRDPGLCALLDDVFISLIYDAEIQLEWSLDRRYAEVEVRSGGRYRCFSRGPAGDQNIETRSAPEAAGAIISALLAR